jgi:signal transduction histidine kinase
VTHAALHDDINRINQARIVPLVSVLAALLFISAVVAYWQSPASIAQWSSPVWQNLFGVLLAILVYLLHRRSRSPRLTSLVYGYAVLGWGNAILPEFLFEIQVGHADHAATALVVYYVSRYVAAMTVVWRPRDLAVALALNHMVIGAVFYSLGQIPTIINTAVWTATAWLGAYALYRAELAAAVARRELQQEHDALVVANARLAQVNQEKSDLMAIAAHDLRSPLMGMTTLLHLTAQEAGRAWPSGVSSLTALEQSCRDMADLVSRVLDVHRAADSAEQLTLRARDLRPTVNKVIAAHEAPARAKGIALTVDTGPSDLRGVHDPQALERVLDNLVSNAVKFTPPGGTVCVRVSREGAMATIAVGDSGPGIPEADRELLFRKFARLRSRPTAGEPSSGLGLYIAKQLVDAMGGSIAVSAGAVTGTTFTVSLPSASA